MKFVPGDDIGKYQVIEFIGNGHFGTVYKVIDRALNVERALKILKVSDPAKFLELLEAQIQFKCSHENCVAVNAADVFRIGNEHHVWIDMELVDGGSLETRIQTGFLSAKSSCKMICDVSYGLENAHANGVLHKDIKPGNILISGGTAKLSDFGVSEYVGAGGLGGGMAYVTHQPPEFFYSGLISVQSDVFSLGMTLFRCLNNISDWSSAVSALQNADQAIRNGTLVREIGWQPWIPKKLVKIVVKACAVDPAKRYRTVREFRQSIEKLVWVHDWVRQDDATWHSSGRQIHTARLAATKRTDFEYAVNNRRRMQDCRSFSNAVEASDHLASVIANSALC